MLSPVFFARFTHCISRSFLVCKDTPPEPKQNKTDRKYRCWYNYKSLLHQLGFLGHIFICTFFFC